MAHLAEVCLLLKKELFQFTLADCQIFILELLSHIIFGTWKLFLKENQKDPESVFGWGNAGGVGLEQFDRDCCARNTSGIVLSLAGTVSVPHLNKPCFITRVTEGTFRAEREKQLKSVLSIIFGNVAPVPASPGASDIPLDTPSCPFGHFLGWFGAGRAGLAQGLLCRRTKSSSPSKVWNDLQDPNCLWVGVQQLVGLWETEEFPFLAVFFLRAVKCESQKGNGASPGRVCCALGLSFSEEEIVPQRKSV